MKYKSITALLLILLFLGESISEAVANSPIKRNLQAIPPKRKTSAPNSAKSKDF